MSQESIFNIILLGPPGSGKGTFSKVLVDNFGFYHLSTGDLIRSYIKEDLPISKKLKKVLDSGELLSDDLMIELVNDKISHSNNSVIWDGFPRTIDQAKNLDLLLESKKQTLNMVILLKVSVEILVDRISTRLVCLNCQSVFNSKFMPPAKENICDVCKCQLIRRDDDKPEKIKIRLDEYNKKTKPLINFYKKQNKLFEIDSEISVDKMLIEFKRIKNDYN